jgi:hypothetical protein
MSAAPPDRSCETALPRYFGAATGLVGFPAAFQPFIPSFSTFTSV